MAGGEDEAQEIVVEEVIDLSLEIGCLVPAPDLDLTPELLSLSLVDLGSAQAIDPSVPGSGDEPGPRVGRDT
jgi:hypothetical protein